MVLQIGHTQNKRDNKSLLFFLNSIEIIYY